MGELEKKKVGVRWESHFRQLKTREPFKTPKQKKSNFAENYTAKTTKNIFL